jgi:hypothetical protein
MKTAVAELEEPSVKMGFAVIAFCAARHQRTDSLPHECSADFGVRRGFLSRQ